MIHGGGVLRSNNNKKRNYLLSFCEFRVCFVAQYLVRLVGQTTGIEARHFGEFVTSNHRRRVGNLRIAVYKRLGLVAYVQQL